jgi:uncharacterized protein YndB with AHSA1/START domain
MATNNDSAPPSGERELVITRVVNAPRELVWKAFTEAERLAQWWGPVGYTMLVRTLDFRSGGLFLYSQRSSTGQLMWGRFVFGDIQAPERLTFVSSFSDADGNITRAPFSPTWPLEISNVVTFDGAEDKTTLTLRGGPINATAEECETFWRAQESVRQGLAGTLDQLVAYLAGTTNNQG